MTEGFKPKVHPENTTSSPELDGVVVRRDFMAEERPRFAENMRQLREELHLPTPVPASERTTSLFPHTNFMEAERPRFAAQMQRLRRELRLPSSRSAPTGETTNGDPESESTQLIGHEVMVSQELITARQRLLDALQLDIRLRGTFEQDSIPNWINEESHGFRSTLQPEDGELHTPADAIRSNRYDLVHAALEGLDSGIFI